MRTIQFKIGKYIIVNNTPILFPLELMHCDVAIQAQSAGFFVLRLTSYVVDVYCWGESTSLNLQSQMQDAGLIKEFINNVMDVSGCSVIPDQIAFNKI